MNLIFQGLAVMSLGFSLLFSSNDKHVDHAYRVMHKFEKYAHDVLGLEVCGSGGEMMDDVQSISLHFTSGASLNIDQARRLVVESSQIFLSMINEDKKLRPYLHTYPFTGNNIKISIDFDEPGKTWKDSEEISLVMLLDGKIFYDTHDEEALIRHKSLHKETYEEAVKIVKAEKNEMKPKI